MATYAIGDIQGCFTSLKKLLHEIQFDSSQDSLWFTGDLVNRGTQSLETLRFVKNLGKNNHVVLGNHDLHLLAIYFGNHNSSKEDTLNPILIAPDCNDLLTWLKQQPLLHYDDNLNYVMVHAGFAPQWDLPKALSLAQEVESILRGNQAEKFLENMYGNYPDRWDDNLTGWDRLRCITNYVTRVRFCYSDGRIELKNKGTIKNKPDNLLPWFEIPSRKTKNIKIIFGHWAALGGVTNTPNTFALDTGCIWGFNLTAMRLEDQKLFQVPCHLTQASVD